MAPPGRARSLLPIKVLAAVVCVITPGAMAQPVMFPAAESCSNNILGAIDDIVNAAYDIVQAAADCTLPGLSELSCASDLTDMMNNWFATGNAVSMMTLVRGSLDNNCAADITQGCADITDAANNLVAAVADCIASPFLCTYDVLTTLDSMNSFIADILFAVGDCNQGAKTPNALALDAFFNQQQNLGRGQRRLQDIPSAGAATSAAAEQSVSMTAGGLQAEEQSAWNSTEVTPAHVEALPKANMLLPAKTLDKLRKLQKLSNELRVRLKDRLKELKDNQGAPRPAGGRQVVV